MEISALLAPKGIYIPVNKKNFVSLHSKAISEVIHHNALLAHTGNGDPNLVKSLYMRSDNCREIIKFVYDARILGIRDQVEAILRNGSTKMKETITHKVYGVLIKLSRKEFNVRDMNNSDLDKLITLLTFVISNGNANRNDIHILRNEHGSVEIVTRIRADDERKSTSMLVSSIIHIIRDCPGVFPDLISLHDKHGVDNACGRDPTLLELLSLEVSRLFVSRAVKHLSGYEMKFALSILENVPPYIALATNGPVNAAGSANIYTYRSFCRVFKNELDKLFNQYKDGKTGTINLHIEFSNFYSVWKSMK